MYNDMLETYRTSLGSADREYQIYLDSWEAKLNQLSASWTSFVNNIISTDAIKTALDGIIALVNLLDTSVVTTTIAIATMSAAFIGLGKAMKFIGATKLFTELGKSIKGIFEPDKYTTFAQRLKGGLGEITGTIGKMNLAIIGATVAITVLLKLYDVWKHQLDNQRAKVEELRNRLEELNDAEGELATLREKVKSGDFTAEEEARLTTLEAENEALREQIRLEAERV